MRSSFQLDFKAAQELIRDTETLATTLHTIVMAAYGDELYGDEAADIPPMDPIDLWTRIETDFRASLPIQAENRLNAIMLATSTDGFYENQQVFVSVCSSLYQGDVTDMVDGLIDTYADAVTLPEVMWGIYEVDLNRDDQVDFHPSIQRFIMDLVRDEVEEDMGNAEQIISAEERFVEEMRAELLGQMKVLGVEDDILQQIMTKDVTPTFDEQGQWEDVGDGVLLKR